LRLTLKDYNNRHKLTETKKTKANASQNEKSCLPSHQPTLNSTFCLVKAGFNFTQTLPPPKANIEITV
jgi:hypothetical protein